MRSLEVDDNEEFDINELEDVPMIRTGVIGEGSCFLHSLFTSMNAREYTQMSIRERLKYVIDRRAEAADELTLDEWMDLSEGETSLNMFNEVFILIVSNVFDIIVSKKKAPYLDDDDEKIDGDIVKFFKMMVKKYRKNIKNIMEEYDSSFKFYTEKIVSKKINIRNVVSKMDKELKPFIQEVYDFCIEYAFDKYKRNLADPHYEIDDFYVPFFSQKYGLNIIFITDEGDVYRMTNDDRLEMRQNHRPFILMHYINESHFESIGLVENESDIYRVFDVDHPVIQTLLL